VSVAGEAPSIGAAAVAEAPCRGSSCTQPVLLLQHRHRQADAFVCHPRPCVHTHMPSVSHEKATLIPGSLTGTATCRGSRLHLQHIRKTLSRYVARAALCSRHLPFSPSLRAYSSSACVLKGEVGLKQNEGCNLIRKAGQVSKHGRVKLTQLPSNASQHDTPAGPVKQGQTGWSKAGQHTTTKSAQCVADCQPQFDLSGSDPPPPTSGDTT
jgi:hypothetical protein